MSAMIALLLVLSTLSGCASEALVNVKSAIPTAESPPNAVSFVVDTEPYDQVFQDEDGEELAVCRYELPVLRGVTRDGEEAAGDRLTEDQRLLLQRFNEPFASWRDNAGAVAQSAREDRDLPGTSATYTDELRCSVYQTDRLISVSGVYYTYTGGAHPNTILLSWNFDLETGEFFDPALLDEETGLQETVRQELTRQAQERAAENGLKPTEFFWEDYEDTLANWSSYAVSFDAEGMTVGFSPYELAAYAAGPQVFQISYEQLSGHLGPHGRTLLGIAEP